MDGKGPKPSNVMQDHHGDPKFNHGKASENPVNTALIYVPVMFLFGSAFLIFVKRLWSDFLNRQRLRFSVYYDCQGPFARANRVKAFINQYLLYAPLCGRRHNREFRICRGRMNMGTVPTRLETLFILFYIALNGFFCVLMIDWSRSIGESLHKLIGTTGTLAIVNLIPLVITAGRNNPLIPLLRISFDTFNLIHRWLGRIIVAECVAHGASVLVHVGLSNGWNTIPDHLFHIPIFTYGFVAAVAFIIIFLQSLSPIRHAFYEFFLHLHIALVAASFVALWHHLREFPQKWIFFAVLIAWITDRILRILNILWRNCGKTMTTATIKLLPGDVAQVDITAVRPWKFRAGQYMYLYIPALGLWTSHPFSVAWESVEKPQDAYQNMTESEKSSNSSVKGILGDSEQDINNRHTISFLVRKRNGFTKKMINSVEQVQGQERRFLALIEGPFGGIHSFSSYGSTILIAGGIGITHSISHVRELVDGFARGSVATRRINLLWIVHSIDHLQWVQPWMTDILNNPVVRGKVTSVNPHLRNPYSLDNGTYSQHTLSLSINIHLTTYYSSDSNTNSPATDPLPASYPSSFTCSQKETGNSSSFIDETCLTPVPPAHAKPFPHSSTSFSRPHPRPYLHPPPPPPSSVPRFHNSSSSSTLNKTIDHYFYEHENENENSSIAKELKDIELRSYEDTKTDRNTNMNMNTVNQPKDWTELSSPKAQVMINLCKPVFHQVLEQEMEQQIGAMAVSVCGPGGMGDEVRSAVRNVQGRKTVDFFEECFSW